MNKRAKFGDRYIRQGESGEYETRIIGVPFERNPAFTGETVLIEGLWDEELVVEAFWHPKELAWKATPPEAP